MKYGSLLRDDLAFTQHEHRTDELGGSIEVYCLSIGGSSVGRGGSSRGHRDCLFFLLLVLNRVGVEGACLWSNCPSCLERSLSMSLLDAGLLFCRVCMYRFVVDHAAAARLDSFAFLLSSGSWEESATKSESGFVRITSAHFAKVDEVSLRRSTKGCGKRAIIGDYFERNKTKCALFPSH